jgi:hypothetical protein
MHKVAGHWFYSLTTGRMLDGTKWTPLPMPAEVIERINVLLAKTGQVGMTFTNMRNEEYEDVPDDDLEGSNDSDADDFDYDDNSSDGDDDDYDDFIVGVNGGNNVAPHPPPGTVANNENDEDSIASKKDSIVEHDDEDVDETINDEENMMTRMTITMRLRTPTLLEMTIMTKRRSSPFP